jgi:hypothetical protein
MPVEIMNDLPTKLYLATRLSLYVICLEREMEFVFSGFLEFVLGLKIKWGQSFFLSLLSMKSRMMNVMKAIKRAQACFNEDFPAS